MISDDSQQPAGSALPTLEDLRIEYIGLYDRLDRFGKNISGSVGAALRTAGVEPSLPVLHRIKSWESIAGKLARKPRALASILELGDLVGVRGVVPFPQDVDRVVAHLPGWVFVLDEEDTANRLGDSEFGYRSVHFTVMISDSPIAQAARAEFPGFRAEVQVRTLCQHVWAEVSHLLSYKVEADVPQELRRSIHGVAAMLEITDKQIADVQARADRHRDDVHRDRNTPLDLESVKKVLIERLPARFEPGQCDDRHYESLIMLLRARGMDTIHELKQLLSQNLDAVLGYHAAHVERLKAQTDGGTAIKFLTRADVVASDVELVRGALDLRDARRARASARSESPQGKPSEPPDRST